MFPMGSAFYLLVSIVLSPLISAEGKCYSGAFPLCGYLVRTEAVLFQHMLFDSFSVCVCVGDFCLYIYIMFLFCRWFVMQ